MQYQGSENNFLGLENEADFSFEASQVVIQSLPYESTSSYIEGSAKGPTSIIEASHYVEFYDEETDQEAVFKTGICTLHPVNFEGKKDAEAIEFIQQKTRELLSHNKFVFTLGAEHTITYGTFLAHKEKYPNLNILQLDAHSDLRASYQGNKYSHASVMARINELKPEIYQVGIRAQCKEEADLIKSSDNIHTWYDYQIAHNTNWISEVVEKVEGPLYITIDADGFDPALIPSVGTAEPGGLQWHPTLKLLKEICEKTEVVGIDIVEVAPQTGDRRSAYTLAQLAYKLIGYLCCNPQFKFIKS